MGDRAHLRRQGELRELESGGALAGNPAYSAVSTDGSSLLAKANRSLNYQLF
jgi:hypothetical protein